MKIKEYALYNHKTDQLLAVGTAKEISETYGFHITGFYKMCNDKYMSKEKRKYDVVELEEL